VLELSARHLASLRGLVKGRLYGVRMLTVCPK
jgi:hypothetical protein